MGCVRHSGAPLSIRLRASFGTSAAVACLSLLCALLLPVVRQGARDRARGVLDGGQGGADVDRRLSQDMYPDDLVLEKPYGKDPKRPLVILHVIGIAYMLLGLNTVCDVYFTGALEVMVEQWQIKPDVAGATFMAAGGSAPELFTSLIGATIAMSDVGFSTIVGSAVFNVLFVIGLCGYAAKTPITLTWWPLFRDCFCYIIGLSFLAVCASDEKIGLGEAIGLFCAYMCYCTIMYFNPRLEAIVDSKVRKSKKQVAPSETCGVGSPVSPSSLVITGHGASTYGKMQDEFEGGEAGANLDGANLEQGEQEFKIPAKGTAPDDSPGAKSSTGNSQEGGSQAESEEEDFMTRPEDLKGQIMWYLSLPIYVPLNFCIPRPSEKWFLATFVLSLLWIAGFSFFLVWWTEILGQVLHIDTVIMGFTLLAAGTSIPDAVSSVAVAKAGEGDMAVSSSIGSNIFDILVGLPVPWMIKVFIEAGNGEGFGYQVTIYSPYLTFYVLLLLFMVFMVVICIHMLGWVLNQMLGFAMAILYLIFLVVAVSVEYTSPAALRF